MAHLRDHAFPRTGGLSRHARGADDAAAAAEELFWEESGVGCAA